MHQNAIIEARKLVPLFNINCSDYTHIMTFGSELQGITSHEALLKRQDAEIRLLEALKKFVTLRIRCDKDYIIALNNIVSSALKFDHSDVNGSVTAVSTLLKFDKFRFL